MAVALHKAALFLRSLPDAQAAALLAKLSPAEAATVRGELAATVPGDEATREALIREFAAAVAARRNARQPEASPFAFLHGLDTQELLTLLGDEHPQTIALVLSQLPSRQAAEAIAALSGEPQAAVLSRIAATEQPSREIIDEVANALRRRLGGPVRTPIAKSFVRVAKMFGAMCPVAERKLLESIAQADPELLQKVRTAIFGHDVAACVEEGVSNAAC